MSDSFPEVMNEMQFRAAIDKVFGIRAPLLEIPKPDEHGNYLEITLESFIRENLRQMGRCGFSLEKNHKKFSYR
jgi:hypothetical protein